MQTAVTRPTTKNDTHIAFVASLTSFGSCKESACNIFSNNQSFFIKVLY